MASISEITEAVVCIELEKENFLEFGCYLYRASFAIMELLSADSFPANAIEILQTLSKNVDLANDLVKRCQQGTRPILDSEQGSIIAQLEVVIKNVGECLGLIPASSFEDQVYMEVAIRSISNEMKKAQFTTRRTLSSMTSELDSHILSLENQLKEEQVSTETDLYPINIEDSTDSTFFNTPRVIEARKSTSYKTNRKPWNMSRSLSTLPQVAQEIEPLYETFFCPLTKKIIDDPVTTETGVTYERKAITEWLEKFKNSEEIFCPITGHKLVTRDLVTNIALKSTIDEWRERNEEATIKVSQAALSLASSDNMVLEAIKDLQSISQGRQYSRKQVCSNGVLASLVKFLQYKNIDVVCAALELLRLCAEEDDGIKVTALYLFFLIFI